MPENPAELPAETQGGGTFRPPLGSGIGGPNELPPPDSRISVTHLVNEIFRLRNRVHTLEGHILVAKIRGSGSSFFGGVIGGPNELPEGEGSSGGGIPFPGEIHEIAELPIGPFASVLTNLVARFTQFERQVSQQLVEITQRLGAIKK